MIETIEPTPAIPSNVCPECGKHTLFGSQYAMTHEGWLEFVAYVERGGRLSTDSSTDE